MLIIHHHMPVSFRQMNLLLISGTVVDDDNLIPSILIRSIVEHKNNNVALSTHNTQVIPYLLGFDHSKSRVCTTQMD
ncbi:hypothetical protein D3C75_950580 [compost metagenome]